MLKPDNGMSMERIETKYLLTWEEGNSSEYHTWVHNIVEDYCHS